MKKNVKKLLLLIAVVITAVVCFVFSASAATEGYYTYEVENGEAIITDVDEAISGDAVIPSTLGGYPVTTIANCAFKYCENLINITIPDSVTSIGLYNFVDKTMIISNEYSYAITWAQDKNRPYAYLNPEASEENIISENLNAKLSYSVNKLTRTLIISCNGSMQSFDSYAAPWNQYDNYILHIVVESGCTNISDSAFGDLYYVEDVYLPDGITSIGNNAFYNCKSLKSVRIPDSVASIGYRVFLYCESLTSVKIPDGITTIEWCTFYDCKSLENITIPDSVTSIEYVAFKGCESLTSITIPHSVTSMGSDVFLECKNLKDIIIFSADCRFEQGSGFNYTQKIYGFVGSTVESFAKEYGITFIDVETIHDHEYKAIEEEGYCSFSRCTCGKENKVPHMDADYNAKCDGCGMSMNDIDIGTCEKNLGYRENYFAFTATKAGDYTFSVSGLQEGTFSLVVLNEDKSDTLKYIYNSVLTYNLKAGQKVYLCIERDPSDYFLIDVEITLSYEVAHKHSYTLKSTSAATCVNYGVRIYSCNCGDVYYEYIKATGHAYSYWSVAKTNSCKEGSLIKRECKNCSAAETLNVIGIGKHAYKTVVTKAATISSNGKTTVKCSNCGQVDSTATVYYPKTIKLSATSYVYDGKTKTPSVTVKDSKGNTLKKDTDYTVKYSSGRKSTGKYSVTITFKGKYSGTKTLTFTIVPKAVTLSKVTAGSKAATPAWKTVSGASGYQVMYSTSSKFKSAKTATVSKGSSKKTTIKKLTKGKKYYFKVRAYKTVGSTKVYGAWSSVKSVKVK